MVNDIKILSMFLVLAHFRDLCTLISGTFKHKRGCVGKRVAPRRPQASLTHNLSQAQHLLNKCLEVYSSPRHTENEDGSCKWTRCRNESWPRPALPGIWREEATTIQCHSAACEQGSMGLGPNFPPWPLASSSAVRESWSVWELRTIPCMQRLDALQDLRH